MKLEVPVLVKGGVRVEEGSNPKITVGDITPLEDAKARCRDRCASGFRWRAASTPRSTRCMRFSQSARARRGCCLTWNAQGDFMVVMEAEGYNVLPDRNFIARVEELCGRGSVRIID